MAGYQTRDSWSQFEGLHSWDRIHKICTVCGTTRHDAAVVKGKFRCPGPMNIDTECGAPGIEL